MRAPSGRRARPEPPRAIDAGALDERITGLRTAVHAADGRLDPGALAVARAVLERAGQRRMLSQDLTVVALGGSTGAGKSSLFNLLVGQEVAEVGVRRPTTGEPQAALWARVDAAGRLLDWLGVRRWHGVDGDAAGELSGLVLVDLPDHDSTEAAHREHVDRLVERVDVMVWVMDPQKYADALVHDTYLKRFARHADVTVVLLNQVDRLAESDAAACLAHLRTLLAADGLGRSTVLPVSARTGAGVVALTDLLAGVVAERRAALVRLAADIATSADGLAAAAGDNSATLRPVPDAVGRELDEALAAAAGVDLVADAVRRSVLGRGRRSTGWPLARWVHGLRRDPLGRLRLGKPGVDPALVRTSLPSASPVAVARVAAAARQYAAAASAGAPAPWVRGARTVAVGAVEGIAPLLDAAVARARVDAPRAPRWWGVVSLAQWALAATAVVGGAWLLALAGLAALALDPPPPPEVSSLPVPTLLLVVGLALGLLLPVLTGPLVRVTAARASARAREAVVREVAEVARARIADPVATELETLARFRVGIVAASGG